jgi:PAS domain S-box-containing protein
VEPQEESVYPRDALQAAEEALRRNQRLFAAFMENVPGAAFMKDRQGRYLYLNRLFAETFGFAPEQVLGKTAFDLVPEDLARKMQEDDERVFAEDRPLEFLHTLPRRWGLQRWLNVRFPIRLEPGEPPVLGGVALDVTKYKQAEDDLRQSEQKYRVLVESAGEAIFTMDADARYLFMNSTAAGRLGGKPEDFVGKTMWDVFPKEIADRQAGSVREVIESGVGVTRETMTMVRGQKRWYRTSINPIRDPEGRVVSALIIARDTSAHKEAELALARSEERFRLTFENAVDAIFWADPATGQIIKCNKAAEKLLGWPQEQIVGRHFTSLHAPEDVERAVASFAEAAGSRGIANVHGNVIDRDGSVVPVQIAASQIVVGNETILQGIFRDRRAEAALDAARLKVLRIREEEQRRMARELHDSIGQQLVAMKMSMEAAGLTDEARRCVEMIHEVRQLCYNLYPPALETLGLASALRQVGQHIVDAEFLLDCESELATARFDAEVEIALYRVAQEAISNAVRHGRAGAIRVSLARCDGFIEMTVADDGAGFDPQIEAGKGLGLRSMTERAEAVGGAIEIRSGAEGTAIVARVPLSPSR